MKNFEFYAFENNARSMVRQYALRGVMDATRHSYSPEKLLKAQYKVYEEWLGHVKRSTAVPRVFSCSFYEWMLRNADTMFVVKPGDLVKYGGQYCVVRERADPAWYSTWRVVADGVVQQVERPQTLCSVKLEFPDGRTMSCDGDDSNLAPADLPPEVFALACGRAKDCPMMKGG